MTRAKQKLCLGSPLFQCSKRAKSSDFVCTECSTRRIDAKRVRFSNYFIFAGEEGSYVCQNPRISAHKFRFVTQFIHMIVFTSDEAATAATEKVNATRGTQYGLHPAHRLPLSKDILDGGGFPCTLNKHQHRLLPDSSSFQDIVIEYLDVGAEARDPSSPHPDPRCPPPLLYRSNLCSLPSRAEVKPDTARHAAALSSHSPSSIIDPSFRLSPMVRHHRGRLTVPSVFKYRSGGEMQRAISQPRAGGGGGTESGGTIMSVARHFGEHFDEIRATSPPLPTSPHPHRPSVMRSSSATVTTGLDKMTMPNCDVPRGVKRRFSTSTLDNIYHGDATRSDSAERHVSASGGGGACSGSSRSSSPLPSKRARVEPYVFANSTREAHTRGPASNFAFNASNPQCNLGTPRGGGGLHTTTLPPPHEPETPHTLIYQMQNLFSASSSPTGTEPAAATTLSNTAHVHASHTPVTHASAQNVHSGGARSPSSFNAVAIDINDLTIDGDIFPTSGHTHCAATGGASSAALPRLDSLISPTAGHRGDGVVAASPEGSARPHPSVSADQKLATSGELDDQVRAWLEKYQRQQAIDHHLDMIHQRPYMAANGIAPFSTNLPMSDPTVLLSL